MGSLAFESGPSSRLKGCGAHVSAVTPVRTNGTEGELTDRLSSRSVIREVSQLPGAGVSGLT